MQDFFDGDPRIVELDQTRDAAEEQECPFQRLLKGFRTLPWKCLYEPRVAAGQGHDPESDLGRDAADDRLGVPEIELRLAGRAFQWNENLGVFFPVLSYDVVNAAE